ncbi:MAG: hypothetical protein Q9160_001500 [Pyrenula sp. 1 TL-2023]
MSVSAKLGFSIPNLDWDLYERIRPAYPASLFSRIFEYHKRHCDRWEAAHDAGSGHGIVAAELAQCFDTVFVSDPNGEFLDVAKERMKRLGNSTRAKPLFHQSIAEDQSWLEAESLDMFTIFMAIWYTDPEKLMQELSRVLKLDATFATVGYNAWPAIMNNEAAAAAWTEYADLWVTQGIANGSPTVQRAIRLGWGGQDCIGIPHDIFRDGTTRIKINEKSRPETDQVRRFPELGFPPSRVRDTDIVVEQEDADTWTREYTLEGLKDFVGTLAHTPEGADADRLWQRVEKAMRQSKQETLELRWTVHIILATRRGA